MPKFDTGGSNRYSHLSMRAGFSVLIFALFGAWMQAQNSEESATTISGTVTDSVTGRGIAGALVILQAGPGKAELAAMRTQFQQNGGANTATFPPRRSPMRAVADESGKYSFTLPEPTFASMQASRTGYSPGIGRPVRDFTHPVDVQLVPTSVIEGRVADSNGEPLPGITIDVIGGVIEDGRKIFRVISSGRTDDLGEYRLWNIMAKSVYVRAAGRQGTVSGISGAPRVTETNETFPTVYFPAAPDRQSAELLFVPPGQTVHADFSLDAQKPFRIRGVIQNAGSYSALGIRLLRGEDSVGNRASINRSTGVFEVYDVTPGSYTLQAYSRGGGSMALGEVDGAGRVQKFLRYGPTACSGTGSAEVGKYIQ